MYGPGGLQELRRRGAILGQGLGKNEEGFPNPPEVKYLEKMQFRKLEMQDWMDQNPEAMRYLKELNYDMRKDVDLLYL